MIIGRKKELKLLEKAYASPQSEFVVVYGRRRVGKTFLVREFFKTKEGVYFQATGIQNAKIQTQLKKFTASLSSAFFDDAPLATPESWDAAFELLHKQIEKTDQRVTVFIDELPWMASKKSGLLETIDYYWNHYWSHRKNFVLVICGSSASWMIKKIIQNKGGLHNRTTCQLRLLPFSLAETKLFLESKNILLNEENILKLYMALGGVPHYLNYIEKGLTADENIQNLLFGQNAPLRGEYKKLFDSLFHDAQVYMDLVKRIGQVRAGISRSDLKKALPHNSTGGRLTERLNDLCAAGFIQEFIPFGKTRGEYYKLLDEFCLFYLYWLQPLGQKKLTADYWIKLSQTPSYHAWAGFSFEGVCYQHAEAIIAALHIKTATVIDSWRFKPKNQDEQGAQIDLLIDRSDDAITLCEIKFTTSSFILNKLEADALRKKIAIFKHKTKLIKQVFCVLISVHGLKKNVYSDEIFSGLVTLKDLFISTPLQ